MPARYRRVLGYSRVSSAEQALGTSLRDQQEAIRAFAASRGLTEVRMYVEAESGIREKEERREQVQALLREVRDGDLVVVDKLDRWSRDLVFTVSKIREVLAKGAGFFSVAENIDASDPNSAMLLEMRGVFAGEEHRRIRVRTVGTRRLLRDKGYWVEGVVPFGYRRRPVKGLEKNILELVPEEAEVVRAIFRRYVAGESMLTLARAFGMKIDRIKKILDRRMYTGEVKSTRGEYVPGHHPAIVDLPTFLRVRGTAEARRKGGPRPRSAPSETSDWVLRDVARCALCGAKMSASYGGRHKRTYYYRCSKACQTRGNRATNGSFVPIGEVESTVDEAVLGRLADLREELARGPEPEGSTQVVDFAAKRKALEGRRTRVLIMFEEGVLDREELRARLGRLDAERTKLDAAEVEASTASILASLETRRCVLRELAVIRKAWRQMRPADRRKVVAALAREVRIAKGREPVWIWMTAEELATNLC